MLDLESMDTFLLFPRDMSAEGKVSKFLHRRLLLSGPYPCHILFLWAELPFYFYA